MKTFFIVIIASIFSINVFAQKLKLDNRASTIRWTGHAEVGSYSPAGTLNFKDGYADIQNGNVRGAKLTIEMNTMHQENEHLLEHLKSEDFFDVKKFPFSVIVIDRVVNGNAIGKLTIKDKTLPFSCPVVIQKNGTTYTISGNTLIDRTSYGIIYNSGNFFSGLGDKAIKNTFDIAFSVILN